MGPKKRRGKKQSPEGRAVASGSTEATACVSVDDGVVAVAEVDVDEPVAQILPPVASDRKLSSAVLVLENCLLTPPQPQPRIGLASPTSVDEAQQPIGLGKKKKSLGIRRGIGKKVTAEKDVQKPLKPRAIRKQTRGKVLRVPKGRVDVETSVFPTTVVVGDEPSSDVDVESGGITGGGDGVCLEAAGEIEVAECAADGEKASEAFPEKRKRRRAFKREKHEAKRKRKDGVVVVEMEDENQGPEEIKVDEVEESNEAENCVTWMVSPLSGDEERMIFKRQRKILTNDSEAGAIPRQCLAPVPVATATGFVSDILDSESPVDAVFVGPTEGDVQEDIDVDVVNPKVDEPVNTDFTALTTATRKGRRNKKGIDSKTSSQSVDQSELEVRMPVNAGQKRKRLGRKNPVLREVERSQDLAGAAALGSRVTRSRRNGNGNGEATESGSLSTDKPSLGSLAEEERELPPSGPRSDADSLEDAATQVNPAAVTTSLKESGPQEISTVKQPGEEEEDDKESKEDDDKSKKRKKKRMGGGGDDQPSSGGSDEDRSSGESPKLDPTLTEASGTNEMRETTTGDGSTEAQSTATSAQVAFQLSDQCSLESTGDGGEATTGSNSDNVSSASSCKSTFSGTLSEKADLVPDRTKESPCHVSNNSTSSGESVTKSDDHSAVVDRQEALEDDENKKSERCAEESPLLSRTGQRTDVSPLLSLECYSEATIEVSSESEEVSPTTPKVAVVRGANGGKAPGGAAVNTPASTVTSSQKGVAAVVVADGEGKAKGGDADMEISSDPTAKDDSPVTTNRKPDPGVSADDVGFVPLKKRRLRLAENDADGEKITPGDAAATRVAASDTQNPIDLLPVNNAEMTIVQRTDDGQQLSSPAPDLLASALSCAYALRKANKYVGTHVIAPGDLAGAVNRASQLGARAFGIFIKPQKTLNPPPLDPREAAKFKEALKEKGYSPDMVVPHGSYLLNCGASDADHLSRSRESLVDDLKRCEMLGLPLFNFHPGAYSDSDSADSCILRVADSINYAHSKVAGVITVIENMSGEANSIGHTFEQLKQIIDGVIDKSRVAVCLDTCHAFAAGYDLCDEAGYRKLMEDFDSTIGRQYLKAMHINDSQGDLGSRVDHHASLGKGQIGLTCFRLIMSDRSLENIPLILETPVAGHKQEIELLYSFIPRTE